CGGEMLSNEFGFRNVTQLKGGGSVARLACLLSIACLVICGSLHGQTFTFTPMAALSFVKTVGGADPLPQVLEISAASGSDTGFFRDATTNSGGNWLSAVPVGFNCCGTPRAITVRVINSASMAVGTYTGQVTFNNAFATMVVPVTLTVQPAGG